MDSWHAPPLLPRHTWPPLTVSPRLDAHPHDCTAYRREMDLAGHDFPTLWVTPIDIDGTRLNSGKINLADELLGSPAVIHFYDSG